MLVLHFAPRTRSVRVAWLLEELELPYELVRSEFVPPQHRFFSQDTPTGRFPTLVDGRMTLCESGAIVEYILERYADGRLAPAIDSPDRPGYLQWLHYAESSAFPPIGIIVWLLRYRGGADGEDGLLDDARLRAASALSFIEDGFGEGDYLVGDMFTAADVMMGFSLVAAKAVGVLDERFPQLNGYLGRIFERPAFKKVAALD